ncbi:MAG: AI-2E family transporter [Actinomycetota bacterium]|nr:AI-2E family transporter [Actinomycetota bacterium]
MSDHTEPEAPAARDPDAMPRWVPRAIVLFFVTLAGTLAIYWVLVRLRDLVVILLVSLVISFALEPAVNTMERRGIPRGVGTILSFLAFVLFVVVFFVAIGALLTDQIVNLIEEGPTYIEETQDWINETFDTNVDADELIAEFTDQGRLGNLATDLADNIVDVTSRVVGVLFQILTVSLFTFYLVAEGPKLRHTVCSFLPEDRQREVLRIWEIAIQKTGGYIYSRALLALASSIVHAVAFTVIDLPFPLPLALWVGLISQFVPVVGTYLAGLLPILIAVIDDPVSALWVLVVIVVYQQIENYLLAPRVTARTMEMHAAVAFGAVIAGAAILGPVGAVLALPVAATVQAFLSTAIQRHEVTASPLIAPAGPARKPGPGPAEPAASSDGDDEPEPSAG